MPTISSFFGIVIRLYYDDHNPPHIDAHYGEHEASIDFETLRCMEGYLPRRAMHLVLDWIELHQQELRDNWDKALEHKSLDHIAPLE